MTKIDVFSGFLGAGKTTLIKKLIKEAYKGENLVLIENEFGEIGIDGGFLKEAGIEIREMNSGCICCSLVGDFDASLKEVLKRFNPDRILIEPSGVGKLSDVIKAVSGVLSEDVVLNSATAVVDAVKCKMYMKNFGEFFIDQIENADCIVLSRTDLADAEKIKTATDLIRENNTKATLITTPIEKLDGADILNAMEQSETIESIKDELEHHHHHKHHDEHDENCTCGCHDHHHHHEEEDEHDHHDHDHHHHHDHDHEEGEAEEYGIGTFVYYRRQPFDLNKFDFLASRWPKSIIRSKGLVYFSNNRDMSYLFEQAGVQKSMREAGYWFATAPQEEITDMLRRDARLREDWDPVYGDRMIKLVIIGRGMDRKAITEALDDCLA